MFLALVAVVCAPFGSGSAHAPEALPPPALDITASPGEGPRKAVLAGGCFWCTEAVFEAIPGVRSVVSGYAGDTREKATYDQVSWGRTKHAESIEIADDPQRVTYGRLLRVFFAVAHDPTQLDRQGPDSGRQYRSAIFYASEDERQVAAAYIRPAHGGEGLRPPDRDHDREARALLPGRGLPPGLRGAAPHPPVRGPLGAAEAREDP